MADHKTGLAEALFSAIIRCIRPLLGPEGMCIFTPLTCTLYATHQLRHLPLYKAVPLIVWRLLRCNPISGIWQAYIKKH